MTEGQRIHHELKHQEELCTCQRQFRINKIGEGKYSVSDLNVFVCTQQSI